MERRDLFQRIEVEVTLCSRCRERPRRGTQRWCAHCHAAYMREWRKTHRYVRR